MDNITTYSARRTSVFVWLAVLLMTASAAARIAYFASAGAESGYVVIFHIMLPVAANIILAVRLPLNSEKRFYVSIFPTLLIGIYFACCVFRLGFPLYMSIALVILCAAQYFLYHLTFGGKLRTRIFLLLSYITPMGVLAADPRIREGIVGAVRGKDLLVISDLCMLAALLVCIISPRRLPPPKPGEEYRLRYGDRADGRLIRNNIPINKLIPYFMPNRNGASNLISDKIEITAMERYIRQKRREGLKHFGITHVLLAAYVRCCAELPGLNRFSSGQKIYQRFGIEVNMAIKKDMSIEGEETIIKVFFDPADTADVVYNKYNEALQAVRTPALDSSFDKLAQLIDYIPGLLKKFCIWLVKTLDYFGLVPLSLLQLSPFHGSLFITSMGSLGIPPIYHHLYDFGNVSAFCAFGCKRTELEPTKTGELVSKKYIDYKFVCDERTIDGFYYAAVFKRMRSLMLHPERLDEEHEVKQDVF